MNKAKNDPFQQTFDNNPRKLAKKQIILSLHWVIFNEVKRKVSSIYIDVVLKHFYIDKTIFLKNICETRVIILISLQPKTIHLKSSQFEIFCELSK